MIMFNILANAFTQRVGLQTLYEGPTINSRMLIRKLGQKRRGFLIIIIFMIASDCSNNNFSIYYTRCWQKTKKNSSECNVSLKETPLLPSLEHRLIPDKKGSL